MGAKTSGSLDVNERMRRIRQRDTEPEMLLRKQLTSWGIRYRVCPQSLPGRPDIANVTRRWAVFVHGCFWHGHRGCSLATIPKTNREFWCAKLSANRARDRTKRLALEAMGFHVVEVWQCQLGDLRLLRRIRDRLRRR
jgi:DNA mismatch endonuclease (patch repair protein)